MNLNSKYVIESITGVPYLLPYGQAIAEHRPSVRLNESGSAFLQLLQRDDVTDEDSFYRLVLASYAPDVRDQDSLRQDIHDFLANLRALGILADVDCAPTSASSRHIQIGTLHIELRITDALLSKELLDFSCEAAPADLCVTLYPFDNSVRTGGNLLIRTQELSIYQTSDGFCFTYPKEYGITEMQIRKEASVCELYCPAPLGEDLREKVFHAIRFAFLVRAQRAGLFAIHSASILYADKAWLFSGPSGTGKSTHTNLWHRLFSVPYLNGDLNLLGFDHGNPVVYGMPWCGTSGLFTTRTFPLGGITFLKQAPRDQLLPLSPDSTILRLSDRLISPTWTKEQLQCNLSFARRLAPKIATFYLACTISDSAAILMKQAIDECQYRNGSAD